MAGWGRTTNTNLSKVRENIFKFGSSTNKLLKVDLPVIDALTCEDQLPIEINDKLQFCSGGEKGKLHII